MPRSPKRPNVLWLMTDEQRTDSMGCYGSPWAHTPNLDRLAREGVLFTNAVTPAPVCGPARASLVTGRYPSEINVWYNIGKPLPQLTFLTEPFHQAGYRTAGFGKRHYCALNNAFQTEHCFELSEAVSYFSYADRFDAREYDVVQYPPEPYAWIFGGRFPLPARETSEARAVREAMAWLEAHDRSTPFLLHVSFNAPHTPVVPPEPYDRIINPDAITFPLQTETAPKAQPDWIAKSLRSAADAGRLTPEQICKARRYYYGEVAFVDSQVGVLLDHMGELGLLQNTIVVFVSDHGTHLGDYGLVQKQTFYEPVVTVPYLFWYPDEVASSVTLHTPVEARGLLPTALSLAGLPVPRFCREVDLADALRKGQEPPPMPVFSEFTLGSFNMRPDDKLVMVRDGAWKLSLCFAPAAGDGQLHNLVKDPLECDNLYGRPEFAKVQQRLSRLIREHLESSATARHPGLTK